MKKLREQFGDFIVPLRYLDSKIHRGYSRIRLGLEKKLPKRFLYLLKAIATLNGEAELAEICSGLGLNSTISFGLTHDIGFIEFYGNLFSVFKKNEDEKIRKSDERVIDPAELIYKYYNNSIRLPLFLTGIGYLGSGLYGLIGVFGGEREISPQSIINMKHGMGLLGFASSLYLNDTNPKILEEQPMWRDALDLAKYSYEKLGEGVGGLLPQPTPQPIPVREYSTLESHL